MWMFKKPSFDSFGKVLALVATTVVIAVGIFTLYDRATRPVLDAELVILYTGWEVMVRNIGATSAKQVRVGVVAWRNGGVPAADVRKSYGVHDLAPGADAAVRIEVVADSDDPTYRTYRARFSTSGYVVVTCEKCTAPRAWAFHIPGSEEGTKRELFSVNGGRWPIAEFRYPSRAPFLNDCVDYPSGVCNGERTPSWDPKSGSSRKDGVLPTPPAWDTR